jgi:hypothetical protein
MVDALCGFGNARTRFLTGRAEFSSVPLEERLGAAQLWEGHGLVFTTELGRPLAAATMTRFQLRLLSRLLLESDRATIR